MIKAIIIEDEDLAATRLKEMVLKSGHNILIVARLSSVNESVQYLKVEKPDLIFLDINLSDGSAFDIFTYVKISIPIIFTTAYSEFAIKAFEQNSIDYILKPIQQENLNKAIFKYLSFKEPIPDYSDLGKVKNEYKSRFLVRTSQRLVSIEIGEIAYFYSEDKLTFIKLKNGKKLVFDHTLKKLESLLDPNEFFRVNRKYILHYQCIKDMFYTSKSKIKLIIVPDPSDDMIFVAVEKIGLFKKWLSV